MTKVTIFQNASGRNMGFEVFDHSGYAEAGEDIVCAAISMLVINTVNSLERFTEDSYEADVDEDSARVRILFDEEPSHDAELLLKSLVSGLTDMQDEESYKDFIDVVFVEV